MDESKRQRPRLILQRLAWIGLALLLYAPWIHTDPGTGNVASDLAAIESLVEGGTFYINESTFAYTIDKMRHDGQFFSQKSPIFHLVGAIPYGVLHAAGFTLSEDLALSLSVLTVFMVIIPMGLLLWQIDRHPWVSSRPRKWRIGFVLIFAVGSLLTPFATTLNHYIPAALFLMLGVNRLLRSGPLTTRDAVWVGFWISASFACDIPPAFLFSLMVAALWCVELFMGASGSRNLKRLPALGAGALPLVLLYAVLNFQIYGSPLPPNMHEETMQYYEGSYWSQLREAAEAGEPGYYQASYPRRLYHATLGHKGIYWMMPLLVVATVVGVDLTRRGVKQWSWILIFILFPLLAVALTMIWAWDLSGGAYAIRHIFATLAPLYCVLAHPGVNWSRRSLQWIGAVAGGWGILVALIGLINPWSHNTLSAYPPLENLARWSLREPEARPTRWIHQLIPATSIEPAVGWLDLGLAAMNQQRLREAEYAFYQALRDRPDYPLARYYLGQVNDMLGKPEEAIAIYGPLVEAEPDNLGAWNNLIVFSLRAGRLDLAKQAIEQSERLAPSNPRALRGRLWLMDQSGQVDPDSPVLRKALERYPDDPFFRALAERWQTLEP